MDVSLLLIFCFIYFYLSVLARVMRDVIVLFTLRSWRGLVIFPTLHHSSNQLSVYNFKICSYMCIRYLYVSCDVFFLLWLTGTDGSLALAYVEIMNEFICI